MTTRKNSLINLLFDRTASITERDEAAIDLSEFFDNQVLTALLSKGMDIMENELILNSCGESLGIIWISQNVFDEKSYWVLSGATRYGVYVVIQSRKPEWIEKYQLEKDKFIN